MKRTWLHDTVAEVIAEFISTDIADVSTKITNAARAASVEKERLPCREPGCKRDFAYPKSRRTHEAKVHGRDASDTVSESPSTSLDCKKQHTEARLWFGLLLADFLDAIKEGDGERLMQLYIDIQDMQPLAVCLQHIPVNGATKCNSVSPGGS